MLFKRGILYLLLSYNKFSRNSLKARIPQDLLYGFIGISLCKYASPFSVSICFAAIGVCVFGAPASVGAFFNFKGEIYEQISM